VKASDEEPFVRSGFFKGLDRAEAAEPLDRGFEGRRFELCEDSKPFSDLMFSRYPTESEGRCRFNGRGDVCDWSVGVKSGESEELLGRLCVEVEAEMETGTGAGTGTGCDGISGLGREFEEGEVGELRKAEVNGAGVDEAPSSASMMAERRFVQRVYTTRSGRRLFSSWRPSDDGL